MNIESVIFDFDGVILNSSSLRTEVFLKFFKQFPESHEEMEAFHLKNKGINRVEQLKYLSELKGISRAELPNFLEESLFQIGEMMKSTLESAQLIDGCIDCLEYLFNKTPIHIASNCPHDELIHLLEKHHLKRFFKTYQGSVADRRKKQAVEDIFKNFHYAKEECLYIGDTLHDYEIATKFKMKFLGIENQFSRFSPDIVRYKNLFDLLEGNRQHETDLLYSS